jgi:hypothetical protein
MIEAFNNATTTDQVLVVLAIFFGSWFLSGVAVVMARGGSASLIPGVIATLLVIAVIIT